MAAGIERDIREIKLKVSRMASLALDMTNKALDGLFDENKALLDWVIEKDREVDEIDNEIDEDVITVCALKHPEASDLRFIVASLKINVAIERVADNAVNIAEWAQKIINKPKIVDYSDIKQMKKLAVFMFENALEAFFDGDTQKSKQVIKLDDDVDLLELAIMKKLIKLSYLNSANIKSALRLTFVARALERIADQATNIAELATFVATGEVVKHKRIKE
ncbi:phosphate signaling complex protein PhoU [Hippea maritima]|uniref:Phosphate-specific transport system accessory protein PhoU n=1 Tax=Hippea maritima (strain ATCC 700847 / DSM 10411 / MH2) TaxID=760142 RepID=F2LVS2_HIPMA|nr:phosphate signaling complex protein PhoU [Hippea maritima]AEA33856.1 phosphate uptake regulator, PhoU [Hippea maritima DSM 10411]